MGVSVKSVLFTSGQSCLDTLKGYSGAIDVTNTGLTCQSWLDQSPHAHNYIFKDEERAITMGNSCRDLGSEGRPWCYTTNPDIRWGYCTLNICDSK